MSDSPPWSAYILGVITAGIRDGKCRSGRLEFLEAYPDAPTPFALFRVGERVYRVNVEKMALEPMRLPQ